MSRENDNRSLFLYTGLIFALAILIVITSILAQHNLEKKSKEVTGEAVETMTIGEKTAQLSEENMILLETQKKLNQRITELEDSNKEISEKLTRAEKTIADEETLYSIYKSVQAGDINAAVEAAKTLDRDTLSKAQQEAYDIICKNLPLDEE